ncbi:uncharacterized protein KD926_000904 [Aspergillus affinis]|uniref:uncharacterized protein n=1 Tax=Aspergillus affinis TaxID=1070780 RepID=UPI0022FF129F|nr:uncharacterized protein KD926_000904 [Aspergillus affinis]KAI9037037.1 hypothetical protein KD926_000904 [Aspergillus affinis]
MSSILLITGATGKQGGSVINALLQQDAGIQILAVTRDANSNGAQKLKRKSPKIELVEGNFDQLDDIFANAKKFTSEPIWGVFGVQDAEERQGKELVDAALENNVKVFIYSSVDRGGEASFDSPTPVPHFISKHSIEHHLIEKTKGTEMKWTILRPVAFLDNFSPGFSGKGFAATWKIYVKEKPLQLISVGDIGYFEAQAFMNPHQWENKTLSLASDELTFEQMAKIFKEKTGRDVPTTFSFIPAILAMMLKDFGYMFKWFYDTEYGADIPTLRKIHSGLKDFGTWLVTESGWSVVHHLDLASDVGQDDMMVKDNESGCAQLAKWILVQMWPLRHPVGRLVSPIEHPLSGR